MSDKPHSPNRALVPVNIQNQHQLAKHLETAIRYAAAGESALAISIVRNSFLHGRSRSFDNNKRIALCRVWDAILSHHAIREEENHVLQMDMVKKIQDPLLIPEEITWMMCEREAQIHHLYHTATQISEALTLMQGMCAGNAPITDVRLQKVYDCLVQNKCF